MNRLESLMWVASLLWELQTPEEKREKIKAQKKSWVYGNCKLSNPDITREMVDRIVEEQDDE